MVFENIKNFRNDRFVTGTNDGLISIWRKDPGYKATNRDEIKLKDYSIVKSFNCGGTKPLIKIVDQDIVVASKEGKLLVVDVTLNVKEQYNTIDWPPQSLSASEQYIAIGDRGYGKVTFYQRNGSTGPTVRVKLKL